MSTLESLGKKRTCPACDGRFYDLNNNPATCPKCGVTYDTSLSLRKRKPKKAEEVDLLVAATAKARNADETGIDDIAVTAAAPDIEEIDDIDDMESLDAIDIKGDDDEEEEGLDGENILDEIEEELEDDDDDDDDQPAKTSKTKGKK